MRMWLLASALALAIPIAEAQVNRCMIDGVTTWQSAPCPPGTDTERITTQPKTQEPVEREADKQAWYEGGTLHRASIKEWRSAKYRNKLATASDWVVATEKVDNLEDAKDLAGELITCVDGSVAGLDADYMKATEIAAACLVIMEP